MERGSRPTERDDGDAEGYAGFWYPSISLTILNIKLALPLLLLIARVALGQPYVISTVAGNGLPPTPVAAKDAAIGPVSVALDRSGNAYFSSGHAVLKMDGQGILTRVAGARGGGELGDHGPATSAHLEHPAGIAVDSAGNVYIADSAWQRVRKVDVRATITTVAGNGIMGCSGDGGAAIAAKLDWPSGLAVDSSGNLYIADSGNNRVRKVTPNGIIRTIAGSGKPGHAGDRGPAIAAQLNEPSGVALDSAGNLYIADSENHRIRKVTPRGDILTIAGLGARGYSGDGAPAISAKLNEPSGIAADSKGNVYIADSRNNCVRKVTPRGIISTIAGNGTPDYGGDGGPAAKARILSPSAVAMDSRGELYIADASRHIRLVSRNGLISTVAGNGPFGFFGDGRPAVDAQLEGPWSLALDSAGNLYFSDFFNARVRKIASNGNISTVAGNGKSGFGMGHEGSAVSTPLPGPQGVAMDAAGNLYVVDSFNLCIRKVAPNGAISTVGHLQRGGAGLAVDGAGNLYVSAGNFVLKLTPNGVVSTVAGTGSAGYSGDGGPAIAAELNQPWGLALDSEGNLYVADSLNNRVRKVNQKGSISTAAGSGKFGGLAVNGGPAAEAQLNGPQGVAVDSAGNLFIADSNHHVVRKVARDGTISTIAGNGTSGYSGDGGTATKAQFDGPGGIAAGRDGRIYVADYRNNCIRVLVPPKR